MTDYFVVKRGSTSLSNRVILSGLSYEALGLLMTELSLRPGTPLGYREMVGRGAGQVRVRRAHAELEKAGLRHRYLIRIDGRLRSVTVVTDEPTAATDLLNEIDLPKGAFLVNIESESCGELPDFETKKVNGSGRHLCRSGSASKNEAQNKQGKQAQSQESPKSQKPSSRCASITEAQPTAAQSIEAGRSPNTLRVKVYPPSPLPPTETQPRDDDPARDGRASRVDGAVAPGIEDHNSDPMTASPEEAPETLDAALVDRCLPSAMRRGLAPRHREQLARMLAERLTKGWSEQAICETLTSRELPPQVRSLYGLVRARLERDVPPDSPVAPVSCDDSAAGQTVPVYRRSDGSAVPGWAICWGDVAVEWGSAQAAGQCGPDVSKQAWLSTQDCDRFIDELKLRRGRRA